MTESIETPDWECPRCGDMNDDNYASCSKCGHEHPEETAYYASQRQKPNENQDQEIKEIKELKAQVEMLCENVAQLNARTSDHEFLILPLSLGYAKLDSTHTRNPTGSGFLFVKKEKV